MFFVLKVQACIFWHKKIGRKAAFKVMVKLTKGVNFSNILRAAFSYKKCAYILGLYFFGARILAQKVLLKCW
jgi:hypothetical protein